MHINESMDIGSPQAPNETPQIGEIMTSLLMASNQWKEMNLKGRSMKGIKLCISLLHTYMCGALCMVHLVAI